MAKDTRQHYEYATSGHVEGTESVETPFKQTRGSDIPRGEMKDSARKCKDTDCDHDAY